MRAVTADALARLMKLPGVHEAVDAARAGMDGLLREPALRRGRGAVRAESRRRGAWASARLAGADVPLESFAAPFSSDDSGRTCDAALRASGEVRDLAGTWRYAPAQVLARLHTLVALEVEPPDRLGRPVDSPPVTERLRGLAQSATRTSAPGIVVAAVVHGEVLSLEPFGWGNDLVARAALRVVLVSRGVDPDALTVPEEGLLGLGADRYAAALAGYRATTPDGVADWLVLNAAAVQQGASVARRICAESAG